MTKYILHGGFNKEKGFIQDGFFQEILKDAPQDTKVLLVYFAEREDLLELRIKQGKEQFNKNKGERNLDIRVASEETFLEDCVWADIICIFGGRTIKLMEAFNKYENLGSVFSNKTIAGDSAGVNALGQLFYSKNSKEVGKGLRILPFKVFVHYQEGIENPLENIEPNLDTLFIKEYETKVFKL